MDLDSQISEKQLSELCSYYEQKTKNARNLIRESLNIRQKIKAKIIEDKDRQASLLQILERLDEYEKVVKLHLEAAEKMEDPESLKKLEIIKKYESMVREQRDVWAKYEEEYEQLPMAKERRKVQLQLLKTSIQVKLLNYNIGEKKKMINLKNHISKRREQLAIINFAKFMVNYKNQEKNYRELRGEVNALKKREQEFRLEIQQLEQLTVSRNNKMVVFKKQPSMKPLSLPPMDLSRFIVLQNNDNADTVSMFSLNLEQEYMDSEADNVDNDLSKASTKKPMKIEESNSRKNEESQETNAETLMDINSEEILEEVNQENVPRNDKKGPSKILNGESSKKDSQESVKKSGRDVSKKRASQNQVSQDYSNSENVRVEQRNSHILSERPTPTPAKMPKHMQVHEDYSNFKNTRDPTNIHDMNGQTQCSPVVAAKVHDWQRLSSPKTQKINRDPQWQHQQNQQHQSQHQCQQQKLQQQYHQEQEKLQQQQRQNQLHRQPLHEQQQQQPLQHQQSQQQRQLLQQQQPQQQQQQQMSWSPNLHQNTDEQNFERDLTGLPQSNKPLIKSNERVHYDTQRLFQKQQTSHKTMKHHVVTPMDISYDENETMDAPPQMIQQSHSSSNQNKPSQHRTINADSMMSVNMYASDTNMSADNISSIIGSDITEPGGINGLVRHLHGDSDDISEDVDIDFDNIMSKFCSPLQQGNSKLPQQPIPQGNNQNSVQFNETAANHDSQEHTNRNFAIVQFQQKNQSNLSQRFF